MSYETDPSPYSETIPGREDIQPTYDQIQQHLTADKT